MSNQLSELWREQWRRYLLQLSGEDVADMVTINIPLNLGAALIFTYEEMHDLQMPSVSAKASEEAFKGLRRGVGKDKSND